MIRLLQPAALWLLLLPLAGVAAALLALRPGRTITEPGRAARPSAIATATPSSAPSAGRQRRLRNWLVLRLVGLSFVVLALTQPVWYQPRPYEARVYLADLSDSVPPRLQEAEADWVSRQLPASDERHPAALIVFGQTALIERPLGPQATHGGLSAVQGFRSRPGGAATNLAAALKLALASLPPNIPARLVLLSDGKQTEGSALELVDELQARHLPVDVITLPTQAGDEVALTDVRMPSRLQRNESSMWVTVIVERTGAAVRVPLRVMVDGTSVYELPLTLSPGKNSITLLLPVPEPVRQKGQFSVAAELLPAPAQDQQEGNNTVTQLVTVAGPARYLVLAPTPPQSVAAPLLRDEGLTVDVLPPTLLPTQVAELAGWTALILEDVPASLLNDGQLQAIERYVTQVGGGLLVLGGPNSYGPGGYFGTALENVLPVYAEAPERLFAPSVALLLLVDQSGSMGDTVTAPAPDSAPTTAPEQAPGSRDGSTNPRGLSASLNKLDLAKQAAVAAATVLARGDLIGVISFQTSPVWAVPLQRAENQLLIRAQLSRLLPGGGTAIAPALEQAALALPGIDATVKHVLLLTDGRGETEDYSHLIQEIRTAGATLTTVAVGKDADRALLAHMAQQGGGRFYAADDPRQVPRIFVTETRSVTRDLRRNETFTPRLSRIGPAPFWPTGQPLPPLGGYVITTPKPQAQVWYTVPTSPPHPLWTGARFGLGQSLAFTSGLAGSWGESWRRWPQLGAFLAQAVRSIARPTAANQLRPQLEFRRGQALLSLEATHPDGTPRSFLRPTAIVTLPSGQQLEVHLRETEPGLYTGQLPAAAAGGYVANFFVPSEAAHAPPERAQAVAQLPYPAEYRGQVEDRSLLFELATLTGGRLLTLSADSWAIGEGHLPTPLSLVPLCLALVALLFLLDLACRYIPADGLGRLRQWWQGQGHRFRWHSDRRGRAASLPAAAPPAAAQSPSAHAVERVLQERLSSLYEQRHEALNPPVTRQAGPTPKDPLQQAWRYLARRPSRGRSAPPGPPPPTSPS